MSWRTVVITTNAKLDYRLGCLVGKKNTEMLDTDERLVIL